MPHEAVAIVGVEFNIYHKSVIHSNKALDDFDIRWTISDTNVELNRFAECLRINAAEENVGDYTLTAQVKDIKSGTVITEKTMILHIISNRTLADKNVLFIGDSLTFSRGGLFAAEIQYNLSDGGIVSIGSQTGSADTNTIGAVKHEGYNGATVGGFLAANVTSAYTNPFYNPDTGEFDLSYFMDNHGYSHVDAVCLNLGHNNIGNHVNAVSGLQTMIAKIHEYDVNIPIIISLITPVAGQDAWRDKTHTAAQMRTHWRNLLVAYMDAFDNGKAQNVSLSTPYFSIDPDNDFPTETVARSARDTTEIVRQNDPMHPNRVGILKTADVYYAYLLRVLPEDGDLPVTPDPDEPSVGYTNLADPSTANDASPDTTADTWLNGYYISSKAVKTGDNRITTNRIPMGYNDTVRITGFNVDTYASYFRILPYDASGNILATEIKPALDSTAGGTAGWLAYMDATDLTNGVYTFKPSDIGYASGWKSLAYIRICGYPANGNDGIIVTVNEPIE